MKNRKYLRVVIELDNGYKQIYNAQVQVNSKGKFWVIDYYNSFCRSNLVVTNQPTEVVKTLLRLADRYCVFQNEYY